MALTRTVINPPEDPAGILGKEALKLIVLGNREPLVEKADYIAGEMPLGVERYVVWYKEPSFDDLKEKFPELREHADFKAFALSTLNKVADVLDSDDREDYFRLDRAFTKASWPQYNQ